MRKEQKSKFLNENEWMKPSSLILNGLKRKDNIPSFGGENALQMHFSVTFVNEHLNW